MESHQTTRLNIKKHWPLLLVIALLGCGYFIFRYFSIQKIVCQNLTSDCSAATLTKLEKLKNRSMFFTNFDRELSEFVIIELKKELPSTMILKIKEGDLSYFTLVDHEVKVVDYDHRDQDLTPIANELINELKAAQLNFQKIEFINQVFVIYLEQAGTQYRALIDSRELSLGVYRLKTVLKHVDLKSQVDVAVKEIDARFKLPVLKTVYTNI